MSSGLQTLVQHTNGHTHSAIVSLGHRTWAPKCRVSQIHTKLSLLFEQPQQISNCSWFTRPKCIQVCPPDKIQQKPFLRVGGIRIAFWPSAGHASKRAIITLKRTEQGIPWPCFEVPPLIAFVHQFFARLRINSSPYQEIGMGWGPITGRTPAPSAYPGSEGLRSKICAKDPCHPYSLP